MPLITSYRTNLKSLRFGSTDIPGDRPGGGWSSQPFIVTSNKNGEGFNTSTADLAQSTPDMFIRGGGLLTGERTFTDLKRLTKYFATVEGGLFVIQQNALSQVGVRIYGGYPNNIQLPNKKRFNDGFYTPASTLASAAGISIGGHPNKQGIDFTGQTPSGRPEYLKLVEGGYLNIRANSIKENKNNRLVNLYNNKIVSRNGSTDADLFSYRGGPGSILGIEGETTIKTASDRTQFEGSNPDLPYGNKYSTFTSNQLQSSETVKDKGFSTKVQDFRKNLQSKPASFISDSPDYLTKNIEQRVKLGDPGAISVDRSNYTKGRPDNNKGLDQINAFYLYKSDKVTDDSRKNDLCKFRIAIIDNDNPNLKTFTHFRAFINSFSDSMGAEWDSFKYTGRGEDFFTYKGFNSTYQMSFTVAAQSIQELSIMYQKLNYIKSTLAPDYSSEGYMRGNIAQLTMGGYLYEVPGIIQNFNITIPNDTTWEVGIPASPRQSTEAIGSNGFTDSSVKELPHRVEVDMTFKPIYNFLPETVKNINGAGNITQRFISLADASGNINNLYNDGVDQRFKTTSPPSLDLPELETFETEFEEIEEEFTPDEPFINLEAERAFTNEILNQRF